MTSCKDILDHLWDYVDKECDGTMQAEIKKHLDLCRSCFSQVEFEVLLRAQMQKKTNHICPEQLKERIKKLIQNF